MQNEFEDDRDFGVAGTADAEFQLVPIDPIDWSDPQQRQRLWLLQLAGTLLGKSKSEFIPALLQIAAAEGQSVEEIGEGLTFTASFFHAAAQTCELALHRLAIVTASPSRGSLT